MPKSDRPRQSLIDTLWYSDSRIHWLLLPLSMIFGAVAGVRRALYRNGLLRSYRLPIPVVVVGNISVGGTGKTPIVLWLAEELQSRGFSPAIVSRGYGGTRMRSTQRVVGKSDPAVVGDEPVLLAARSGCPVFVDRDRVAAAQTAAKSGAEVIICDDGLQHYRLRRDVEIAVVDGNRGLGNGNLLPAGPLREPESRLDKVARIMVQVGNGRVRYGNRANDRKISQFRLIGKTMLRVGDGAERPVEDFAGQRVHAIAGIGNPQRFFDYLRSLGMDVIPHAYPDHARLRAEDVQFDDDIAVVMTEKDAVKCRSFPHVRLWCLPVSADVDAAVNRRWLNVLEQKIENARAGKSHD